MIDAATRLFVRQGYATTTMRAIATEASVSVPTVELLFGTKAQLLHVVMDVAVAGDDEPVPVLSRAWRPMRNRRGTSRTSCQLWHRCCPRR